MGPAFLRAIAVLALVIMAGLGLWALRRQARPVGDAMPWTHHIDAMRRGIMATGVAFLAGTALVFSLRLEARGGWPVPVFAMKDNMAAQLFRVIADHLVPEGVELIVVRPLDGFLAEATIALAMGAVIALPIAITEAIGFFGPAMRPEERRALRRAIVPALGLFLAGAAFAWAFVLPFLLDALYGYPVALGATPFLQVAELVTFTVTMLLLFGAAFQLPLVMTVIGRAGLVSWQGFLKGWRVAFVLILVVSALMTDPTVISQVMVAGPLLGLYGLGIVGARLAAPS